MGIKQTINKYWYKVWQFVFLLTSTSWLLAPTLNKLLSGQSTLISEYEFPSQPFSLLFRFSDALAGLLVVAASSYVFYRTKHASLRKYSISFMIIGILMIIDVLATTSCKIQGNQCITYPTFSFYIHAIETSLLVAMLFGTSLVHAIRKKSVVSTVFVTFQLFYGVLEITRLAKTYNFQTLSQYSYQIIVLLWIAWFMGLMLQDCLKNTHILPKPNVARRMRLLFSIWAYINGSLAIVLSLSHIHVFGAISGLYFANDNAWLAQHGVIIGLYMLYLSFHLYRGEARARQLFLIILLIETLKYSIITPQPVLMAFYWLSFTILFCLDSFFTRGAKNNNWHQKMRSLSIMLSGVLVAIASGLIFYLRSERFARIANDAFQDLTEHTNNHNFGRHTLLQSTLLTHMLVTLLFSLTAFVLWILFQPTKNVKKSRLSVDVNDAERLLESQSLSSEDFFKLWPRDKSYFWNSARTAFISYKIAGNVIFALADPIAATKADRQTLLHDYILYWQKHGYRICFLVIPEESLNLYSNAGLKKLQIGSNAVVDIEKFNMSTVKNKWWRWQKNRALKAGYIYKVSDPPHANALLNQCERVSQEWLNRSGHKEQGFALASYSKEYLNQCKVHYVTNDASDIVAFTNQLPRLNQADQATVDMIRFRPDCNNTMPYLLMNTIGNLADETDLRYFDLGFVPLAKTTGQLATIARVLGNKRFSAAGLEQFKNKFEPEWNKNYLAYDGELPDLASILINLDKVMQNTIKTKETPTLDSPLTSPQPT